METIKQIRNDLFKREEVSILIKDEKNPGFLSVKKKLSQQHKKSEDLIEVNNVKGKFGRDTFLVKAYIYDSLGDLQKAEQKSRKVLREERKVVADAKKAEADAKKKATEEANAPNETSE